jgi:hypothetical protein
LRLYRQADGLSETVVPDSKTVIGGSAVGVFCPAQKHYRTTSILNQLG